MRSTSILALLICGGLWMVPSAALAQSGPFGATNGRGMYTSSPAVSPYVNLQTNPNGLSNYQTLVKPLIEEREALERQQATLEQLNRRVRGSLPPGTVPSQAPTTSRPSSSVRFMHYSHYYNTGR